MAQKGFRPCVHFDSNPVEERPRSYARELVKNDAIRIIKGGGLAFKDEALSVELIYDLMDRSHHKLGLDKKDVYTTDEILFGWIQYLPRWIINLLNSCNDQQREGIFNSFRWTFRLDMPTTL